MNLEAWADEEELLGSAEIGEWVNLAGQPYTGWMVCKEILSAAQEGVMLVDPYVDTRTLSLLLVVPPEVPVRVLTATDLPGGFETDWQKFCGQRGGTNRLGHVARANTPHDRFLVVDERLYLSGASFKDIGGRLSVIVRIESESGVTAALAELERTWLAASQR